jgi:hypothetical protein
MSERRGYLVAVGSELVFFDDEPATEPAPATVTEPVVERRWFVPEMEARPMGDAREVRTATFSSADVAIADTTIVLPSRPHQRIDWRDADTLLVDGVVEVQRFGSWTDPRDANDALGEYARSLYLSGYGDMRACALAALAALPNAARLTGWTT